LNGRNPFQQDEKLFNYDYDSEGEWEEDEGEDIVMSEGEEDEEENELEYDDFFLRDNDFGSDAGSDGEEMAAVTMRFREGEECIGPIFINKYSKENETETSELKSSAYRLHNHHLKSLSFDKDVMRLCAYNPIFYSNTIKFPMLGIDIDTKKSIDEMKSKDAIAQPSTTPIKMNGCKSLDGKELYSFLRYIHGRKDGIDKIIRSYLDDHPHFKLKLSKNRLRKTFNEYAMKSKSEHGHGSLRWLCKPDIITMAYKDIDQEVSPSSPNHIHS
jgi:hypothetical protein